MLNRCRICSVSGWEMPPRRLARIHRWTYPGASYNGTLTGRQFQLISNRPPHQLTLSGTLSSTGNATGTFEINHDDSLSNGIFVLTPRAFTKLQL